MPPGRHFFYMEPSGTVIIIAGPTAVGKTAFAIETAKLLDTDIISADSRQCYKELDIGVARPSAGELEAVKHYFINSHSIYEPVNAAAFEQYALSAARDILAKKDVAVMVGGTGLYIKAFCEGLDDIPAIDGSVRQKIAGEYEAKGLEWLQQQVQEKDPVFWKTGEQQNPRRLMRALEVKESTGDSITTFRQGKKQQRPFRIIQLGLDLPREALYERINTRVGQMMDRGLVHEAAGLLPHRHLNALQTVGYKELFDHFDGRCSLDEAVTEIKKNTRHYAKRQLTWFRRDENIRWYSPLDSPQSILRQVFKY